MHGPELAYMKEAFETNWMSTVGANINAIEKQIAEMVSQGIDYVRVDLYEIDGVPMFGEMTFTPAGNVMSKYMQWVMDYFLKVYKETKSV